MEGRVPRFVGIAIVALVAQLCAMAPSAHGEPVVLRSWRAEPEGAVAVDRGGRVATVATSWGPRRSRVTVRAFAPDGVLRWERVWRPTDASIRARDIAIGPGGLVIVVGQIQRFEPPFPCDEIWSWGWAIRAWSADGTARWQRLQHGWRACEVFGTSGWATDAAGATVAMAVWHGDEYASGARIVAFDLAGRLRWQRELHFAGSDAQSVGDVAVGGGGAVYAAATRNQGALDTIEIDQDAVLVKFLPDGTKAWSRAAPDRVHGLRDDHDRGTGVAATSDGVVFASVLFEPGSEPRARLERITTSGDLRWARSVSGAYLGASRWVWSDAFAAVWAGGPILGGNDLEANGHGSRVTLRGYDPVGLERWRARLGPESGKLWGITGIDAEGRTIVVTGQPPQASGTWSRVWVLRG